MSHKCVRVALQLCLRRNWAIALSAIFFVISPAFAQNRPSAPVPSVPPNFQSAQQTNDRITQLALAANVKPRDYLIGSGDIIAVEVFDAKEFSRDVRVTESGYIAIPLLPVRIQVVGLTTVQLEEKITELLQANGLVSNPQVSVAVKEQHSSPITVAGAVVRPVTIQAVRQTSLLEAISEAGGLAPDAGSTILITRAADPNVAAATVAFPTGTPPQPAAKDTGAAPAPLENTITIDLNDLLDTGESKFNIPLIGGDVVTVPRAGVIYAVGAVQHAGGFVMQSDRQQMSVLKVLSLSGGVLPTAKPHDAVVLRQGSEGREQLKVDLNRILSLKDEDVPLRPGDILFVPDSTSKRAWRKTGEIALSIATGTAIYRAAR